MADLKIFKQMALIQKSIDAIGKTSKNQQQGYLFRGINAVYNELSPILKEHEVFMTSEILSTIREERQTARGGTLIYSIIDMRFTFHATDGSSVSTEVRGEGMDSGDKASNKAMAVAHKYVLTQTFTIAYEGQVDPDSESHEVASAEPKNEAKPKATPAAIKKMIARIEKGETGIIESAKAAFTLTNEQINLLTKTSKNVKTN